MAGLQAAKLVIGNHPKILLLPTLFSCVFLLAAIFGILTTADNYQEVRLKDRLETVASSNLVYEREASFMQKEATTVLQLTQEIRDGLLDGLERVRFPPYTKHSLLSSSRSEPSAPLQTCAGGVATMHAATSNQPQQADSGRLALPCPGPGNLFVCHVPCGALMTALLAATCY
jgi:hypothetical protein